MGIVNRIWPREVPSLALEISLAERLKQISERAQSETPGKEADAPLDPTKAVAEPAAQDSVATAVAEMEPDAEAVSAVETAPDEQEESAPADAVAGPESAASADEVPAENHSEVPATEETAPVEAEQQSAVEVVPNPESDPLEDIVSSSATPPEQTSEESDAGNGLPSCVESKPEAQGNGNHGPEIQQDGDQSADIRNNGAPLALFSPARDFGLPFFEQVQAAVDRAEATGKDTLASVQRALAELQATKQEFEAEIRDRLDVALAEYERRLASEALVEDAAGQLEGRTRQATEKIFREVKEQAWVMLNAVAGELRSFRDQFGKEIQERVGLLDQATQQAMDVKEGLDQALPQARDVLQSLPVAGQEAAARVHAASAALAEQLHSSREALSLEIAAQKEAMKALLQDCHQDELRLKEEIEKFRTEAGNAFDLLGRKADESLDRLNAGVEDAAARAREGIGNLAGEIEQRMLSGDLIEKATVQIDRATQEVVEPALERLRNAGAEADSVADSLTRTGEDVVSRLGTARQDIESRLGTLMGEQMNMLEFSMTGFHHKAAEEIGNVVERVVAQSSRQLDERLRSLFDELLSSTSEQIKGTTRDTLSTLHDGLKGVFEPAVAE